MDSPFLRAVASVLFAAACAWALAHFMYRADERSAVCTAVRCTVSEDVALEGVVIRSEQLLRSDPAPGVSAVPGERLAADSAVAFAGDEPVMTRRSAVFFDDTDGYEYSKSYCAPAPKRLRTPTAGLSPALTGTTPPRPRRTRRSFVRADVS